jgi:hypothetical protein
MLAPTQLRSVFIVPVSGIGITPIPVVAIIAVAIAGIPVIGIGCEPIPIVIRRTSERSGKKPPIITAKDLSREEPALTANDWPGDKRALTAKDPSGDKPALAAKVPSREEPAIVAAEDPPSGEKPAVIAAKIREAYVHGNPATAAPTPAIPALCNGLRWIPTCQSGQCSENGDAPQHDSLFCPSATPRLGYYFAARVDRKAFIASW